MYRGQNQDHDSRIQLPAVLDSQSGNRTGAKQVEAIAGPIPQHLTLRQVGKRTLIAAAVVTAITGAGVAATDWWVTGRYMVSTDDAYVLAHNTTLASKISGYVSNIPVGDNARVHAGDVIATIDDGDYRLAVDAARDKVATQ